VQFYILTVKIVKVNAFEFERIGFKVEKPGIPGLKKHGNAANVANLVYEGFN
jgi:hypothetical protein